MLLRPGTDLHALEEKLLAVKNDYILPYMRNQGDKRADVSQQYVSFELQPVGDVYLKSQDIDDNIIHGDIRVVWLFGSIALFILLIACINFVNLSTAKSANRAKEVGLRKVVGSFRTDLIRQFLTESLVYSTLSFVLGLLLAWWLLPYFNILADKNIHFPWAAWWLFPVLAISIFITGVFAGIYPALYLSGFKPISVLKGNLSRGSKSSAMRSSMVVFQFTTSVVLIICTFITYRQMKYILNKELGFDKEQVVMIQGANTLGEKQASFKEELQRLPAVMHTTISDALPVAGTKRDFNSFWREGRNKIDRGISAQKWQVDPDYLHTLGIKLIAGRGFMENLASDSASIIINQTMARELGLENPIGERIMNWRTYQVIGVVEDFHFESLKGEIGSLCLIRDNEGSIVSIKVATTEMTQTLQSITHVWKDFMPNQPIRYTFLDQKYAQMYKDVQRTSNVFIVFAGLAIIVACLGLFALSAFMIEQRGREVGIRKVLGASLLSIFSLLTFDFLKLVFVAIIIAVPLGWYLMKEWLSNYVYQVDISWDIFMLAGAISLIIALLTISTESWKAAFANPIDSIRSE